MNGAGSQPLCSLLLYLQIVTQLRDATLVGVTVLQVVAQRHNQADLRAQEAKLAALALAFDAEKVAHRVFGVLRMWDEVQVVTVTVVQHEVDALVHVQPPRRCAASHTRPTNIGWCSR